MFEDELNKRFNVVISKILHALGETPFKLSARKCVLKELPKDAASDFLDKYHIQGTIPFKKAWGLFFDGKLIQMACIGSLSRKHVSMENMLEFKRGATLPFYYVRGGTSRLFKYMKKFCLENGYQSIKSYCDMRYANPFSDVYTRLGFEFLAQTKYTPHYFKAGVRYRTQSLKKTPEEKLSGKTKWQLKQEQGYDRIWDCGHKTYLYQIQ